jgi:hypothetical protein
MGEAAQPVGGRQPAEMRHELVGMARPEAADRSARAAGPIGLGAIIRGGRAR